jgi:hypothetical protein
MAAQHGLIHLWEADLGLRPRPAVDPSPSAVLRSSNCVLIPVLLSIRLTPVLRFLVRFSFTGSPGFRSTLAGAMPASLSNAVTATKKSSADCLAVECSSNTGCMSS